MNSKIRIRTNVKAEVRESARDVQISSTLSEESEHVSPKQRGLEMLRIMLSGSPVIGEQGQVALFTYFNCLPSFVLRLPLSLLKIEPTFSSPWGPAKLNHHFS